MTNQQQKKDRLADLLEDIASSYNDETKSKKQRHINYWFFIAFFLTTVNIVMLVIILWQRHHIKELINLIIDK